MERVGMQSYSLTSGTLLLAEPFMLDHYFRRAVILLCSHADDLGSVGFILNKPMDTKVNNLLEDFPEFDAPVFYGGPVSNETIHYIHDKGDILDESEPIGSGIYWGGDFNKLKFLIESELILPKNIRFYLGYSGWSPLQLQDELAYGSWVVSQMHPNHILKTNTNRLWIEVMSQMGNPYSVIAQIPDSYYLN